MAGTAVIRTDDPESPRVQGLIGGAVSGKVQVALRKPSFGIVQQGRGAALSIRVRPFDGTIDLGTVTAESSKGVVRVTVRADPDVKGEHIVDLALPKDAVPGAIDDVVVVRTTVAGEERIELPVSGTVLPKRE